MSPTYQKQRHETPNILILIFRFFPFYKANSSQAVSIPAITPLQDKTGSSYTYKKDINPHLAATRSTKLHEKLPAKSTKNFSDDEGAREKGHKKCENPLS